MALLDVFKKKAETKKEEIKPAVKAARKPTEPKLKEKEIKEALPKKEIKIGEAYRILKAPHVTERATALAKKNQYVFEIYPRANKVEVKKSVEDVYGVDVISVKIINIPPKKRRLGRREGVKPGYKKAIVKIKEGQKIEVLPR